MPGGTDDGRALSGHEPPARPSPFERGDAFVPASGPPRREAGARLPGAVPVPGVLLPVPPALGVPALFGLRPGGERGDLEAVVKDAESKLPIALRQCEQVLVHILRRGAVRGQEPAAVLPARPPPPPRTTGTVPGPGLRGDGEARGNLSVRQAQEEAAAPRGWGVGRGGAPHVALPGDRPTHLEGLPALVRGGRGGGGAVLCAPARAQCRRWGRPAAREARTCGHP